MRALNVETNGQLYMYYCEMVFMIENNELNFNVHRNMYLFNL